MARTDLNDITAFLAVAREGSFTRAAARLGVSQSALSQTVRTLEARHYSAQGAFVLDLDDPLGFSHGRYRLTIDESGSGTVRSLEPAELSPADHHLALSVAMLGAIYLGGTAVSTLVRAGRITEVTTGAAAAADSAFRSTTTPWLSTWF